MFGMGFMEILLIAIIAIIALGPDKLPDAMVQIAKFIRKLKSGLDDAKSTLDSELNVSEMKEQANKYKAQIDDLKSSVSNERMKLNNGLNDLINDEDEKPSPKQTVETKIDEVKTEEKRDDSDKFKVKFNDKKEENV